MSIDPTILNVVALCVLAFFVVMGLIRGTLAGVLRLTNLVLAYMAAYFASTSLGEVAGALLNVANWIGAVAAGTAAFFGTYLVLSVISWLILSKERERVHEEGRSALDRLGGGLVGGLQGGLIVLLIGVLGNWLQAAESMNATPSTTTSAGPAVEAPRSLLTQISSNVIETAVTATMGDTPEAKMAANLAARPAETMENLQEFVESPQVASLQHDELFWQYVSTGAVDQALNRGSFRSISHDAHLRGQLVDLGLIGEDARNDPAVFRAASRAALGQVGPKLNALRNDPQLQALAADPVVQSALASGDTLSLLTHPPVRNFINKVTAEGAPASN